jgi:hypothetical protein
MTDGTEIRPPRGALAVIAVGLFATIAAALLSTDAPIGAATLEWVEKSPLPDSKAVDIPGGGKMRLTEAGIRSTEPNAGQYTLFRVAAVLQIDQGAAIGQGRIRCDAQVPRRTIVAKTHNSRASYPRSSDNLAEQPVSETSLVEFSSHSTDLASIGIGDVLGDRYTREDGIVVEWAPYRIGRQVWKLGLPAGRPAEPLRLPFVSIWRTTVTPAAKFACTVETAAGKAIAGTAGTLVRAAS